MIVISCFYASQTKILANPDQGSKGIDNGKLLRWSSNKDCAFIQLRQEGRGVFSITMPDWKRPDYLLQNSQWVFTDFCFFLWSISFIFEGNNLVQCKSIISILLAKIVLSKSQIHTCNAKHTKVEQFQVITNRTNFISFYQWMLIFISLFLILNIGSTVGLRCGQKSYDHKVSKLLKKQ